MAGLLSVEEALARVLARVAPLPSEQVPLELAAGRMLAEQVCARVDLPPFASSAMDGFAVRCADLPGSLPVVGRIAAGRPSPRALDVGEAMEISTGGVVPAGADAVVPIEHVVERDGRVEVGAPVRTGDNVRPRGGDARAGDEIAAAGAALTPTLLAALSACGVAAVASSRRPRVALLSTGTELRPPGAVLGPGEIYESNGVMLAAALAAAGAAVDRIPTVADDRAEHREAIARGLDADLLVTTGGVSVGVHDLVRSTEAELGVEEVFWGVAMRPGKPLSFATRGATLVFGLPGNPVSSLVGCLLFVLPALRALQGAREPAPRYLPGSLTAALRRNPARDEFVRARAALTAEGVELTPLTGQESHMIVHAAAAGALVHVPRGEGELAPGSPVRYVELGASPAPASSAA